MLDRSLVGVGRIDFISAYCDRWCERCAYTSRCSAFAVEAAVAMCGDMNEGFELALGRPYPEGNEPTPPARPWLDEIENTRMTAVESADFNRREGERESRLAGTRIMTLARACTALAHEWLLASAGLFLNTSDEVFREALEIVEHDAIFIQAKLHRALDGRDRRHDDDQCDEPIQNDWNGSAKVALISLQRSSTAWEVIATATGEEAPTSLAQDLTDLLHEVETEFPDARLFVRPGFDEPDR
jgi:hypothetical protein